MRRYARVQGAVPCAAAALYAAVALAQSKPPTATLPPVGTSSAGATAGPVTSSSAAPATSSSAAPATSSSAAPATSSSAAPATSSRTPATSSASPSLGARPLGRPPPPGYAPRYGYPYPGYPYSYGYGYAQGYGYAPRAHPEGPSLPRDAAAQNSPFLDALVAGVVLDYRIAEPLAVGGEAGVFVAGRVRLVGKMLFNTSQGYDENHYISGPGWTTVPLSKANFEWGASAGYAVVRQPHFVMAVGLAFLRTNRSAYGNFLGVSLPFDWVNASGLRLGLEAAFGQAFGGTAKEICDIGVDCTPGQTRDVSRPAGTGGYVHFELGFGFNEPEPIDVKRQASSRAH